MTKQAKQTSVGVPVRTGASAVIKVRSTDVLTSEGKSRPFGDYIKELRQRRNMSLRDVEQKCKISNAYLSQVERNKRGIPTVPVLRKLAKVYGVPLEHIAIMAGDESDRRKKLAQTPLPPDAQFIVDGYDRLPPENKHLLTEFLNFLLKRSQGKIV